MSAGVGQDGHLSLKLVSADGRDSFLRKQSALSSVSPMTLKKELSPWPRLQEHVHYIHGCWLKNNHSRPYFHVPLSGNRTHPQLQGQSRNCIHPRNCKAAFLLRQAPCSGCHWHSQCFREVNKAAAMPRTTLATLCKEVTSMLFCLCVCIS